MAESMFPAMSSRELPGLLCAAAWLRCCPDKAWVCALLVRLHRCMDRDSRDPLSPQGLALSAWALSKLGMRMHKYFAVRWTDCVVEQLPRSSPGALALQMYSLAVMRRPPEPRLLEQWLEAAGAHMDAAAGQDLANMLWGLAKLK